MSNIEQAVYAILSGAAGVTALVSTRIYPVVIPQDVATPAIAYQRISEKQLYVHGAESDLARPRVQVTAVATSYTSAKAVAAAVKAALSGYVGTAATVSIKATFLDNEADEFTDGGDLYAVRQDYFIWHS